MTWIGLLLVGCGVTDLLRSLRLAPPARPVPVARAARAVDEAVGAAAAVLLGLLAGLTAPIEVAGLVVVVGLVVAWGQSVHRAFDGGSAALPLAVLAGGLVLAVAASPLAGEGGGALGRWLGAATLPGLEDLPADRALLLLGAFAVQLSTGNVLVRLVLTATGTVAPEQRDGPEDPSQQLKGGRLLGPMERLVILGLGIAGELTAASIVIAAKGLLRWPELQSRADQQRIHRLTEYFLVGSFVSWLVALGALALLS